MIVRIQEKREECKRLFSTQVDFSTVEHDGLRNPLQTGTDGTSDVPYWELADTIPNLLEHNITLSIPGLTIPLGCTLREYVMLAIQERAIVIASDEDANAVEKFINLYERLRYSSRSMPYPMFMEMMDALVKVGRMIELGEPELYKTQSRRSSRPASTRLFFRSRPPASLMSYSSAST